MLPLLALFQRFRNPAVDVWNNCGSPQVLLFNSVSDVEISKTSPAASRVSDEPVEILSLSTNASKLLHFGTVEQQFN